MIVFQICAEGPFKLPIQKPEDTTNHYPLAGQTSLYKEVKYVAS